MKCRFNHVRRGQGTGRAHVSSKVGRGFAFRAPSSHMRCTLLRCHACSAGSTAACRLLLRTFHSCTCASSFWQDCRMVACAAPAAGPCLLHTLVCDMRLVAAGMTLPCTHSASAGADAANMAAVLQASLLLRRFAVGPAVGPQPRKHLQATGRIQRCFGEHSDRMYCGDCKARGVMDGHSC